MKTVISALQVSSSIPGTPDNDILTGTNLVDTIDGKAGSDRITALQGNDLLVGGIGNDTFIFNTGDGTDTIVDFGGVGRGREPSLAKLAAVDTLQFIGSGFTARNLRLAQVGKNVRITFDGVSNTRIILQNLQLDTLENLRKFSGASVDVGNLLFNGQTEVQDEFDIFNANKNPRSVFGANSVTFLNDLNNITKGLNQSADVINAQGGDDLINGLSGDDLLRGEQGNDTLWGDRGKDELYGHGGRDTLNGGIGDDLLNGGRGPDQFIFDIAKRLKFSRLGIDTITDFRVGGDRIVLDKTTFKTLTSNIGRGFSNANEFATVGSDDLAATSKARIVYSSGSGKLFYNSNGSASGFGTGGTFAVLSNLSALSTSDFVIVA